MVLATLLVAAGVALSLATFAHDVRRGRISREMGAQLAPRRIAPEVHALAALLVGLGVGLIRGWPSGCIGAVAYGAVVYLVVRPLTVR